MGLLDKLKNIFGLTENQEVEPASNASQDAETPRHKAKQPVSSVPPAGVLREEIIQFIVHSLRPYTNEEHPPIRRLKFFILCKSDEEAELAGIALYKHEADKFKQQELQRKLINNYIYLPDKWLFESTIVQEALPDCRFRQGIFALQLVDEQHVPDDSVHAKLLCLEGQTVQTEYILDPSRKLKYSIGRGKQPVLDSNRTHHNDIVFLNESDEGFDKMKGRSNMYVSRNHAYIVFNSIKQRFFLYVDKGGLPSNNNKTKILKAESDKIERLDIMGAAHELANGDQIELGGEAKLLFVTNDFI